MYERYKLMQKKPEKSTLDQIVGRYLTENPDILLSLQAGVVNISKLALLISQKAKLLGAIKSITHDSTARFADTFISMGIMSNGLYSDKYPPIDQSSTSIDG